VDARLVKALQPRGVEVETTVAPGLLRASAEAQVLYAARRPW
jgi:hypothetical protein